jgi:hypothetical protein
MPLTSLALHGHARETADNAVEDFDAYLSRIGVCPLGHRDRRRFATYEDGELQEIPDLFGYLATRDPGGAWLVYTLGDPRQPPLPRGQGRRELKAFLEDCRVFRTGNALLDKVTKGMCSRFAGHDSTYNKFECDLTGRKVLFIGCGQLFSACVPAVTCDSITFCDPLYDGTYFQAFDPTDYDAVVSDVSMPNSTGTGMSSKDKVRDWVGDVPHIRKASILTVDARDHWKQSGSKVRPHNLEVIVTRGLGLGGGPCDADWFSRVAGRLIDANQERNAFYKRLFPCDKPMDQNPEFLFSMAQPEMVSRMLRQSVPAGTIPYPRNKTSKGRDATTMIKMITRYHPMRQAPPKLVSQLDRVPDDVEKSGVFAYRKVAEGFMPQDVVGLIQQSRIRNGYDPGLAGEEVAEFGRGVLSAQRRDPNSQYMDRK